MIVKTSPFTLTYPVGDVETTKTFNLALTNYSLLILKEYFDLEFSEVLQNPSLINDMRVCYSLIIACDESFAQEITFREFCNIFTPGTWTDTYADTFIEIITNGMPSEKKQVKAPVRKTKKVTV